MVGGGKQIWLGNHSDQSAIPIPRLRASDLWAMDWQWDACCVNLGVRRQVRDELDRSSEIMS
jgi:hypothetical protein